MEVRKIKTNITSMCYSRTAVYNFQLKNLGFLDVFDNEYYVKIILHKSRKYIASKKDRDVK